MIDRAGRSGASIAEKCKLKLFSAEGSRDDRRWRGGEEREHVWLLIMNQEKDECRRVESRARSGLTETETKAIESGFHF